MFERAPTDRFPHHIFKAADEEGAAESADLLGKGK